ncbi:uncharacterized protein LOC114579465 [Dendrobium catenatum]|uniref:uncharacterized protein LOC114579465 n=1 Tax=Dendrobium catenatum TaxID=906689 RepID=UPI00109EF403|nr:uncharacterized protein LOC114579465 [Dendrobium catenatum]
MDAFSCAFDDGKFKGISCSSTDFNHLLYANEVLVFGEAKMENAINLKATLDNFAASSGLSINEAKCSIIFSQNTCIANVSNLLGFSMSDHTIKYLGLPIFTKNLSAAHFQPLLSKFTTLLACWKVKFLSFTDMIQYLKFTIANTIAYWIRAAILRKHCFKSIDKLCSKFLFHGSTSVKKLHLIARKKTCLPIAVGGLGIPDIQSISFGFGCTFIWRLSISNSLIVDWFRYKHVSPWKPSSSKAS